MKTGCWDCKVWLYFQSFHTFLFLIMKFWFVLLFSFIDHFPPIFLLLSPLLLDYCHFAFVKEQSLRFSWKIVLTDHWSLSFPGTMVYFPVICVFRDENLPPILKFVKIVAPLSSFQPLPLCPADKNCAFVTVFHFTNSFSLSSNSFFHVWHFTYTTKQSLKPVYFYEK